jgi:hypothetical protein
VLVDRVGDELLAAPRLAHDQDRARGGCHDAHPFEHLLHGLRPADDVLEADEFLEPVLQLALVAG